MKNDMKVFPFMMYKSVIGAKHFCFMFNKVDRFMMNLFGPEKYEAICDRIKYIKGLTSSIT